MRKFLVFTLCLSLCGCASANARKLSMLRTDNRQVHSLSAIFDKDKKEVFDASIKAIKKQESLKTNLADVDSGEILAQTSLGKALGSGMLLGPGGVSGVNVGIFLEGKNPTSIRVAQLNYGANHEEYVSLILGDIKQFLNQ